MFQTSLRSTLALLLLGAALVLPSLAGGMASTCVYPGGPVGAPAPIGGAVGQPWTASTTGGTSAWCAGTPPAFDALGAMPCAGVAFVAVAGAWCDAVVFAGVGPAPPMTCTAYPSTTFGSGAFVTLSGVMGGWDVAGAPPPGTPGAPPPGFVPGPGIPPGAIPVGAPDGNLDGWDLYVAGPLQGGIAGTTPGAGGEYTVAGIYPPMFGPAGWAQLIAYPVATYTPPAPLGGLFAAPTIPVGCI